MTSGEISNKTGLSMRPSFSHIQGARGVAATRLGDCDVLGFAVCPGVESSCFDDAIEIRSIGKVVEFFYTLALNNLFVLLAVFLVARHSSY